MNDCSDCKNNGTQICSVCCSYQGYPDRWEAKPKTNADRIRGKDDEGLAEFICSEMFLTPWCDMSCGDVEEFPCRKCVLAWLKQEVEI